MAGHFNFGNYIDVPVCCIFNYLAYLVLRIKAAVRRIVVLLRSTVVVITDHRLRALTAYGSQTRIFFYFDAPALIVSQMPVEIIQLIVSHQVDGLLYKLNRKEMTAY